MEKFLKNKKILFIAPVYYDYEKIIMDKIKENGGDLIFFSEKKDGLLFGILNNIHPILINFYQKIYYFNILKKISRENFSHFFLIRGYKIPFFFLKKLKELNPNIEFILYQWDSNKNNPYFHILKYFDKSSSFDIKDCQENKALRFLQLFYTDEVAQIAKSKNIKYEFFCFSSFSINRYKDTIEFLKYCNKNDLSYRAFCFIPKTTYFRLKYLNRMKLEENFLSFNPMTRSEYCKNLSECATVVDLSHDTQTGLSMRVVEAFGAGKKVLTTNKSIINNPIYSPDWVQVLSIDNIKKIHFTAGENYHRSELYIDNWLKKVFY
jgi:hypothetical protein